MVPTPEWPKNVRKRRSPDLRLISRTVAVEEVLRELRLADGPSPLRLKKNLRSACL